MDLGSGRAPRNPLNARRLIGIDIIDLPDSLPGIEYLRTNVGENLPLPSSSASVINAFDFLEHLPRIYQSIDGTTTNLFIHTMNEAHRVLEPNGLFIGVTPAFPRPTAFEDPTLVNPIGLETVNYFAGPSHAINLGYGYMGRFGIVAHGWLPRSSPLYGPSAVASSAKVLGPASEVSASFRPQFRGKLGQAVDQLRPIVHRLAAWGARRPCQLLWVLKRSPRVRPSCSAQEENNRIDSARQVEPEQQCGLAADIQWVSGPMSRSRR